MQAVLSDPRAQLPVDNAKYVRNCAELHMAGQSITDLAGFEPFTNLEALWLNRNKVRPVAAPPIAARRSMTLLRRS